MTVSYEEIHISRSDADFFLLILPQSNTADDDEKVQRSEQPATDVAVASIDSARSAHTLLPC
jgi:hypothetical protein